ncbi:MAG: S9 family peptidase [Bacteroidota bacterium]
MSSVLTALTEAQQVPHAQKKPTELEMHGDKRTDDYYWLNDYWLKGPDSDKVVEYLNAENDYFAAKMKSAEALQEKLYQEILGRIKQTDESVPYFKNGYWYITKTENGKEYPTYVRKKATLDAPEELLIDINKLAEGNTYCAIGGLSVSPDNKLLAYSVDIVSRRKYTVYFKDLETGELLPDIIPVVSGGVTWANDNNTVFYTHKNDITLRSDRILRHQLGTAVETDKEIFNELDETYSVGVGKTKSEQYILIQSGSTLSSEVQYLDANDPLADFKVFHPREKELLYEVDHFENKFYINTNWDALNFRLMECPLATTGKTSWKEVIPTRPDVLLEGIEVFKNFMVLSERSKALTQLRVIDQTSKKEHYINFGEAAYVAGVSYNPEFNTSTLRFNYQSMTTPPSTFDYNMLSGNKKLMKQQEIVGGYDPANYTTERLWATAADGTKIPVSLVYKNGFKKDGQQPLLLYSYGSYGISTDPSFSLARLSLLNRGFVFAIAHIRGGQEMGRQWYEDGKMFKKKNTFTDFIACADFLIANKYTSKQHLYANGGSAGGLLIGAVVNLRPELWHGVIAAVPFVDVLTTMLDESIPLTTGEFDEWGNPKNKESYFYMKSYSPYDNLVKGPYPNILVTTGLHDSQVQYFEPAKYVAKLRELKTDNNLLLMHCNMNVGHGGASGRFQRIKETARDYAFFLMLEGIKE